MDKIDTLISYLLAIQAYAKDIHYKVSGDAFYSKHLLADEVYEGIDEHIDTIIETCILPYDTPKHISDYWESATYLIPGGKTDFDGLVLLLHRTIDYINKIELNSRVFDSVFDEIAQDLQHKLGLITRQVE